MTFAKHFFSLALTSFTLASGAHADFFVSRLPTEPDYLVQRCIVTPTIRCSMSVHLDQKELRALRHKVMKETQKHSLACFAANYLCDPNVTFSGFALLIRAHFGLRDLIRAPQGGLVQVEEESPAAAIIFDAMKAKAPLGNPASKTADASNPLH